VVQVVTVLQVGVVLAVTLGKVVMAAATELRVLLAVLELAVAVEVALELPTITTRAVTSLSRVVAVAVVLAY
jgi:hypothetical protein